MKDRSLSCVILLAILCCAISFGAEIGVGKQIGSIYIRPDGSVEPSTAMISSSDNVTYYFDGNINEPVLVERNDIVIDGNKHTLQGGGSGTGFSLVNISNVTIRNTVVRGFNNGIYFGSSCTHNVAIENLVINNTVGIVLAYCSENSVTENNLTDNGWYAVEIWYSSRNSITGNRIARTTSLAGIGFGYSSYNSVAANEITENPVGIGLYASSNNTFYHNNFINNTGHAGRVDSSNVWNFGNPSEGNYWSGFAGKDSDYDGIADTPNTMDPNNIDNYPLMGRFSNLVTSFGTVNVATNSSISDFQYFENDRIIQMYVSNTTTNQTYGFCRICIPHALMNISEIRVVVDDGLVPTLHPNYTLYDNETHRWIYFAYEQSTRKINVVPEFTIPTVTIALIIMTIAAIAFSRCACAGRLSSRFQTIEENAR